MVNLYLYELILRSLQYCLITVCIKELYTKCDDHENNMKIRNYCATDPKGYHIMLMKYHQVNITSLIVRGLP